MGVGNEKKKLLRTKRVHEECGAVRISFVRDYFGLRTPLMYPPYFLFTKTWCSWLCVRGYLVENALVVHLYANLYVPFSCKHPARFANTWPRMHFIDERFVLENVWDFLCARAFSFPHTLRKAAFQQPISPRKFRGGASGASVAIYPGGMVKIPEKFSSGFGARMTVFTKVIGSRVDFQGV